MCDVTKLVMAIDKREHCTTPFWLNEKKDKATEKSQQNFHSNFH